MTPEGERLYAELSARMAELAERLAADMEIDDLKTTVETLGRLKRKLADEK
mgnify:FL=1|jgi:DNA-binding MarR family transcriptional regulator